MERSAESSPLPLIPPKVAILSKISAGAVSTARDLVDLVVEQQGEYILERSSALYPRQVGIHPGSGLWILLLGYLDHSSRSRFIAVAFDLKEAFTKTPTHCAV